jgi:hypothetical protein
LVGAAVGLTGGTLGDPLLEPPPPPHPARTASDTASSSGRAEIKRSCTQELLSGANARADAITVRGPNLAGQRSRRPRERDQGRTAPGCSPRERYAGKASAWVPGRQKERRHHRCRLQAHAVPAAILSCDALPTCTRPELLAYSGSCLRGPAVADWS